MKSKHLFRLAAGLIGWSAVGYPLALQVASRLRQPGELPQGAESEDDDLPTVALIVPAYAEAEVIADKVANALALDYPREKLQVVVACDGSPDDTAGRARQAGADLVLELPRGGKVVAQDTAVAVTEADVVAFSDANSEWEPDASGASSRR